MASLTPLLVATDFSLDANHAVRRAAPMVHEADAPSTRQFKSQGVPTPDSEGNAP